ncbi:MAG: XRE family transcriptional regulator [Chlamydiales bacterium]
MGSGNVFADLGLANPEEALAKTQLVWKIAKIIKKRKLTQKRVAAILKSERIPHISVSS